MKKITILLVFLLTLCANSQDFITTYTTEITKLKTESEKDAYWNKIYELDQFTYLRDTKDPISGDSISLTNMMRTALMFEIHGTEAYKLNNTVPILNFTHNYISDSNLAFWPIIQECQKVGGVIESFGGQFPAYQLEGIALSFYDYSLFDKASQYPRLLAKLTSKTYPKVSTELATIYTNQKALQELNELRVIGEWMRQQAPGLTDNGTFEFVSMSDGNLYLRREHRLQKLIRLDSGDDVYTYRIHNEPFGWTYKLRDGQLSLIDDRNNTLIHYNTYN